MSVRSLLVRGLDRGFDRQAWHGPTLAGALRGVSARQALWRPGPGRHSIWEITLHAAYWKYAVRQRLEGGRPGAFPRKGSNWLSPPSPADAAAWRRDLALLKEEHRHLRRAVGRLTPAQLARRGGRGRWTNEDVVQGIAAHDLYHAGQIQLLKRLQAR